MPTIVARQPTVLDEGGFHACRHAPVLVVFDVGHELTGVRTHRLGNNGVGAENVVSEYDLIGGSRRSQTPTALGIEGGVGGSHTTHRRADPISFANLFPQRSRSVVTRILDHGN